MVSLLSMRVLIGITAAIIGVAAVIVVFSTSLSVGGAVYRLESETCASCHYEEPYYEGWKTSVHGEENVTCQDCHAPAVIKDETCLNCHEDYDLSNKTKFLWDWSGAITPVDHHDKTPHIGPKECIECHLEHEFRLGKPQATTKSICNLCHIPYIGPRQPEG
jgi:nitrate/TMAO reductase-like tetraheme cytochrome c subunit